MKALLALFILVSMGEAYAFPTAPFNALLRSSSESEKSLQSLQYDFEGIVKLSNCSGALISFSGQPITAAAIVMTNGHCIQKPGGYLTPGEVWVNRPLEREMELYDGNMNLFPIKSTQILYATMTNTDVAFYELSETYLEILNRTNIRPFLLDSVRPLGGISIDIVSGYWDRGYSCEIDGFVYRIKEGDWTFTDSIRYTAGCDTIGGTSGSPIIARGERKVVAINNTSNRSGETCTQNNPCEVNEEGEVTVLHGGRYGQQTYNTYTCLTPDFKFDLNQEGCSLPK